MKACIMQMVGKAGGFTVAGLIATNSSKAVHGYVYEHVHVNDHGFRRRLRGHGRPHKIK